MFQDVERDYLRGRTIIRRKLAAIYNKLEDEEFQLIFSSPLEEQEFTKAVRMFKASRVSGILLLNEIETSEEKEVIKELSENGLPVISLNHPEFDFDLDINYVETDRFEAGRLVGNHFSRSKHKQVSVIGSYTESKSFKKKLLGFEKACRENNLILLNVYEGALDYDSAYRVCHEALSKNNIPTAFFCHNDETAIAFIRAANNLGIKIPEEVAVVGFDNTEITKYMIPSISSVDQPCSKIGEFAAELLLKQIKGEGKEEPCVKIFPSTLKVRTSSKN
ncbi:MAG: LacI family DNA-binding transcriptional regulator [Halanaerobiales bacterium]